MKNKMPEFDSKTVDKGTPLPPGLFSFSNPFERWMDGFADGTVSLTGLLISYRLHTRTLQV
jgi:hypothetical protein